MYAPAHFLQDDPAALRELIRLHPLATVIRHDADGLCADHIPLLHEPGAAGPSDALGELVGHVARQNPLWQVPAEQELLLVFQGPSAYISPNWYASKADGGKVVPTWNYAVVHAHCTLQATHRPEEVLDIIGRLTDHHEASQPHPWRVSDAPIAFTERLLDHIVGIRLKVHRWQGKWKVSQNQPVSNQRSVVQGLIEAGSDAQRQVAGLVARRRPDPP